MAHRRATADHTHPFEEVLSVSAADIEFELRAYGSMPWADYLLNPRRLRGSDFLMRWSQGVWSEERLTEAINETGRFVAFPYGPSGTAPDNDVRAFELYFERWEAAGLGQLKRPDLLLFRDSERSIIEEIIQQLGGVEELPFTVEEDPRMQELLARSVIAVECENSLWRAGQMPDFGATLKPQKWLDGKLGLKKAAVAPTVIIKEQDLAPLRDWQQKRNVPIHIWHVFYDLAFGIALDTAVNLIAMGNIAPTSQTFQAPGGATTKKTLYKVYYHYAYPLGTAREEADLVAASITDKNGHILPYVRFVGGRLEIAEDALRVLDAIEHQGRVST
jgi:hypothetical protein